MDTILISGGNGFLGKYFVSFWNKKGLNVHSLGRGKSNNIVCNLADNFPNLKEKYKYAIHCSGKAHIVPKTQDEADLFEKVNYVGTKNFLKGLNCLEELPKAIILVSSVSVYGLDKGDFIKESAPLLANDPYGKSKILAEEYFLNWVKNKDVNATIIRLPLIVGANAPGNLHAMINGIKSGKYANLCGGKAKKSMVLAKDIAEFSPILFKNSGIYNLTDGNHPSFKELSATISKKYSKKKVLNLVKPIALSIALFGDLFEKISRKEFPINLRKFSKMTKNLTFDDSKARDIGWKPQNILNFEDW
ncbi:NAD(P)-dependent oxidoreductase [Polaribacter sp. PL03]|uniref:NAD-dependent epimerase/dehydratase family protein n=1 Tax=Polaribacter sp. PL03 TaxID=3088353 RepID=UPI0029CEE4DC|nr:NAD(P)-dependent oxidoreductase [Polaribacter sp. PL03]MDX6747673.1 NAD(P)-dependent oxidoreductase [Polaribacter sp. PL03]